MNMLRKLLILIIFIVATVLCCNFLLFAKATSSEVDKTVMVSISSPSEIIEDEEETEEDIDLSLVEEPEEDIVEVAEELKEETAKNVEELEIEASPSDADEELEETGSDGDIIEENVVEKVVKDIKDNEKLLFGVGNTYTTDQFLVGIENKKRTVTGDSNITKITFLKGGAAPGYTKIHEVSGDTGVYANGTEIIVYTTNAADVLKLSEFSWSGGRGLSEFVNVESFEGLENLNASDTHCFKKMFQYDKALTSIDISKLGSVWVNETTMMFLDCESLETIAFGTSFDTSGAMEMGDMFSGCKSLTSVDIGNIDTRFCKNFQYMFNGCEKLTTIDLSTLDMHNVISMYRAFEGCKSVETIKLPSTNAPNLSSIGLTSAFSGCENLQNLDFGSTNTAGVQIYDEIFKNCKKLTSVDLSNFNTVNAISFNSAFENCNGLTSLDLTSFNTKICNQMKDMFKGCTNLTEIKVSSDFVVAPISSGYASGVPASGNSGIFTYTGYIITFVANGGSGSMLPQPAVTGGDTILRNNTFSRSGYTFSSWIATNSNVYGDGANIGVVTHDMTLTAQWTYVGGDSGSSRRRSSDGGGGSGGGGGGGGGIPVNKPVSVPIAVNNTFATKAENSIIIDSSLATITKDLISGKSKMTVYVDGVNSLVTNTFITLNSIKVDLVDGNEKLIQVSDTYFFDGNGEMVTGWLKAGDGGWYFFDVFETNIGKEVINQWK